MKNKLGIYVGILAAFLILTTLSLQAAPLRFQLTGTIKEASGEWESKIGETVTIEITGDLDTSNGTFEMVNNDEEDSFPRYTFSGGDYGAMVTGSLGSVSTQAVSFEPVDNFDADANGNPFGLTGIVDAITILIETPASSAFSGSEIIVNLFHDSDWIDNPNSLPADLRNTTVIAGVVEAPPEGSTVAAAQRIDYQDMIFINGADGVCGDPVPLSVGDTVNGELSRINDCFYPEPGRLSDSYELNLESETAFSLTHESADFAPLVVARKMNESSDLVSLVADMEETGSLSKEFVLSPGVYKILANSLLTNAEVPPAGNYTLSLADVSEPQSGCQLPTTVTSGVTVQAGLDDTDCKDDTEGRSTFDAYVDGYIIILQGGDTVYATLEASFASDLVWEAPSSDDVIEEDIPAGSAYTLEISADEAMAHTLVIAAADNAALGTYTLTFGDAPPASGGDGGVPPNPDTTPDGQLSDELFDVAKVIAVNNKPTSAMFSMGASPNNGVSFATDFTAGDAVSIVGRIDPDPADVGLDGEFFVAVKSTINNKVSFSVLNTDGIFEPWDLTVSGLVAAQVATPLLESNLISVFKGSLAPGKHSIYMAYVAEGGILKYTGKALKITVGE